jgi:hypothetical protein
MPYDVEAVRAERVAKRTQEPFRFKLDGREWTMIHAGDVPLTANTWTEAQWTEHFVEFVEPQYDDEGALLRFPLELITREDIPGLMEAWIGGSPGE